jgi:transcriptional regulator with XRE-family HTH domain
MMKKKISLNSRDDEFRRFLEEVYENKRLKNPRLSLRAFALLIRVDQSLLSKVLRGERNLSQASKQLCLEALEADPRMIETFTKKSKKQSYKKIEDNYLNLLADWRCFAVLELFALPDVDQGAESIAKRLGTTTKEMEQIYKRLLLCDFIKVVEGRYTVTTPSSDWTQVSTTSESRKKLQREVHRKNLEALDAVPFDERDHSFMIMAVDRSAMPKYKLIIRDAIEQMNGLLQKSGKFNDVYALAISLAPLTQKEVSHA